LKILKIWREACDVEVELRDEIDEKKKGCQEGSNCRVGVMVGRLEW
jgi:hypothetical protein